MLRTVILGGLLVGLALTRVAAQPAPPQSAEELLAAAETAIVEAADFEGATTLLQEVLRHEEVSPPILARAHIHLAAMALLFDRSGEAVEHVRAAVLLDATTTAPDGAPEQLTELLEQAKEQHRGPARLTLDEEWSSDEVRTLTLRLHPNAPSLGLHLRLTCGVGDAERRNEGPTPTLQQTWGLYGASCRGEALSSSNAVVLDLTRVFEDRSVETDNTRRNWILGIGGGVLGALALSLIIWTVARASRSDQIEFGRTRVQGWSS